MPLIIEEKLRLVELIPLCSTRFFPVSDTAPGLSSRCIHLTEADLVRSIA
jgi:hypothetical protein